MKKTFSYLVIIWVSNLIAHAQVSIWSDAVTSDGAMVVDTTERSFPSSIEFNFGSISGEGSYEFIVNTASSGESQAIARTGGDILKLDQYGALGRLGFTTSNDFTFTPDSPGSDATPHGTPSMVTWVIESTGTKVYVNGALAGTTSVAMTALSGMGRLGGSIGILRDDFGDPIGTYPYDSLQGTIYGVATFNSALTAQQISDHYTAFAGSSVPEPSTWGLLLGGAALVVVGARRRGLTRSVREPGSSGPTEPVVQIT